MPLRVGCGSFCSQIYIADTYVVATWKSGKDPSEYGTINHSKSCSLLVFFMKMLALHGHKPPAQIIYLLVMV